MGDMVKVRYLGPDEIKVLRHWGSGDYTFERGAVVEVPADLAKEVLAMNERGCTLENARAYDQHLFEVVTSVKKGGAS